MTDADRMDTGEDVANASAQKGVTQCSNVMLDILPIISKGQREHGMRHRDYARYRAYCARRLARLYETCKLKHGKGKYVKKKLDVEAIADERALLIPLVQSERAWSYAMELKEVVAKKRKAQCRQHLLKRMRKAVSHANELVDACTRVGNEQTALEADAYASYIAGISVMEQGKDWTSALKKLLRAKRLYSKLGLLGDQERLELYRERVEEIMDSIRFASFQQGQTLNIEAMEEEAVKDLMSNSVFMMEIEAPPEIEDKIKWHGMDFPLKNRDARVLIAKAREIMSRVATLSNPSGHRASLMFAEAIALYDEARSKLNDDVAKEASKQQYQIDNDDEDKAERIKLTEIALSMIVKDKVIDRHKLVNDLLDKKLYGKAKRSKADKRLDFGDLARMYDEATIEYDDLMETAPMLLRLKPEDADRHIEEFEVDCEAEIMILKAKHNMALASQNFQMKNFEEGMAYFEIATELAKEGQTKDCAEEIHQEATELLVLIAERIEKAKATAESMVSDAVKVSGSSSDLTSQVTQKLTKLFSWTKQ